MSDRPIEIEVRKTMRCPCGIEIGVNRTFHVVFQDTIATTGARMSEYDVKVTQMMLREYGIHVETEHKK